MSSVPTFLTLPTIAMENILSMLSLIDIFELSLCSAKTHKIVSESINAKNIALEVHYEKPWGSDEHCRVTSTRAGQSPVTISVITTREEYQRRGTLEEERVEERRLMGMRVRVQKATNTVEIVVKDGVFQTLRQITDYILDLFKVAESNLKLNINMDNTSNPIGINNFNSWRKIQCAQTIQLTGGYLYTIQFERFLRRFLGNSRTRKNFTWSGVILDSENFGAMYFPPLDTFSTMCTNYITAEVLYKLDIRVIYLRNCCFGSLTFAHFNSFIKMWLENVEFQQNLEVFMYRTGGASYRSIENGLPLVDFDGKRRPEEYTLNRWNEPVETIDCTEGRDLVRSDGKVATLVIKDSEFFAFIVWPNLE